MRKTFQLLFITTLYIAPVSVGLTAGVVHVDSSSALERALASSRKGGAKEISLRAGAVIRLAAPMRLDARDSGLRITSPAGGAILSGGSKLTGWRQAENGIWRAKLPDGADPRELYVNGRRAVRARFPNQGWLRIEETLPDRRSGFIFGNGDLPGTMTASDGLEMVFLHDWSISRIGVASIDRKSRTLRAKFPIGCAAAHYAIDHFEKQPRYALEGTVALIDAPGEWATSKGHLYYRPRPGEIIGNATAVIPHLHQLLEIAPGPDGRPPKNIRITGVTFAHCRWDIPVEGYASGQATMHEWRDGSGKQGRHLIPAAVRVSNTVGVIFEQTKFRQLGGSGLWIGEGSRDCVIRACEFSDIAGNGVNIGETGTQNVARGITVTDSTVRDCGTQYFGSIGIWIGMAADCTVENCEIRDLPYTGISVGWRWNPTPSPCQGHRIVGNHIHHVMQVLSDGGGIYTLGRQPGTVLARNHIHDVPLNAGRAQSNGIFMDEGTTDLLVEGNTIDAIAKSPIRFHKAGVNTIRSNLLGVGKGEATFTFNATDSKVIRFENNRDLPAGSKELKAPR